MCPSDSLADQSQICLGLGKKKRGGTLEILSSRF